MSEEILGSHSSGNKPGPSGYRYLHFRQLFLIYALVLLVESYVHKTAYVQLGLRDSTGHYLLYLTYATVTCTSLYAAVSYLPLVHATLATPKWELLFHPRGLFRLSLYHISCTTELCLTLVFWTILGIHTEGMPIWAQIWAYVDNIGVHGSLIVWLLLDGVRYDPLLRRGYTVKAFLAPLIYCVAYVILAVSSGMQTGLYPYFFLDPGFMPFNVMVIFMIGILVGLFLCHLSLVGLYSLCDRCSKGSGKEYTTSYPTPSLSTCPQCLCPIVTAPSLSKGHEITPCSESQDDFPIPLFPCDSQSVTRSHPVNLDLTVGWGIDPLSPMGHSLV
ncbi:hypothetical protein KIPB_000799 [Kipferlia bialata]|uniref:FAR-17a/AIG1-like protein n=1 Tax=Kipferlia bialata TaxID=797122 RepID=A0A9K3CPQ3_9EUKA|nr:hypothetical protein KIPB_000799 [Kipferlia bialata]|eukprot:g799.t1